MAEQQIQRVDLQDVGRDSSRRVNPAIYAFLLGAKVTPNDLSHCWPGRQPSWFYLRKEVKGILYEVNLCPTRKLLYAEALSEHAFVEAEVRKVLQQADESNAVQVLSLVCEYLGGDVVVSAPQISFDDKDWDDLRSADDEEEWR